MSTASNTTIPDKITLVGMRDLALIMLKKVDAGEAPPSPALEIELAQLNEALGLPTDSRMMYEAY